MIRDFFEYTVMAQVDMSGLAQTYNNNGIR